MAPPKLVSHEPEKSVEAPPYMTVCMSAMILCITSGGGMPDPDTWDPNIIYSTRRTLLAPIVILAGLVVEIIAIFK